MEHGAVRIAVAIAALAPLGYGIGVLVWDPPSVFSALCADEIASIAPMPGAASRLVVIHRDCGATTSPSTLVGVDGDPESYIFSAKGRLDVTVSAAPGLITVTHPAAEIFRQAQTWEGTPIAYIVR